MVTDTTQQRGWCLECKTHQDAVNLIPREDSRGRVSLIGDCAQCGATITVSRPDATGDPQKQLLERRIAILEQIVQELQDYLGLRNRLGAMHYDFETGAPLAEDWQQQGKEPPQVVSVTLYFKASQWDSAPPPSVTFLVAGRARKQRKGAFQGHGEYVPVWRISGILQATLSAEFIMGGKGKAYGLHLAFLTALRNRLPGVEIRGSAITGECLVDCIDRASAALRESLSAQRTA